MSLLPLWWRGWSPSSHPGPTRPGSSTWRRGSRTGSPPTPSAPSRPYGPATASNAEPERSATEQIWKEKSRKS